MQPLEGAGSIVVYEFQRPPPLTQSATQDSPYKKDVLPIFGCPVSNCVSQMGSQKSLNMSSSMYGQFGLSLLLTRVGNGSSPGCPGACREGRKESGGSEASEGPLQTASTSTCSFLPNPLRLPQGRLQEQGPDLAGS